jgi:phospholipid-binding lipoprotein MlaA
MPDRRSPALLGAFLLTAVALAGCAAPNASGPNQVAAAEAESAEANNNDPWENTNRDIFAFNQAVDQAVLVPVADTYRNVLPDGFRTAVHNVLRNLDGPVVFLNDVLQAQPKLAGDTLLRFVMNTTMGLGGLLDFGTLAGVPYHSNDLGITLAVWGFPDGGYLVIPVLGPSSPRDAVGRVGDGFADPGNIVAGQHHLLWASFARAGAEGIDERSRNIETLADIEKTSLDYYATIRSLYRQRRAAQIRHENTNLPNVTPVQGGDSPPAMTYTFSK